MKAWIAVACVCASSFTPIVTAARANVAHSCNVFDAAFCFPKPWNAVLTLEPGPDFEVYRVSTRADESLFSIYVGMAPQARDGRVTVKNYKVDGVELNLGTFTGASGNKTIDMLLRYPNGLRLHIFGAGDQQGREALADAMTGFRRCTLRGVSSIDCETRPLFDKSAVELVRNLK